MKKEFSNIRLGEIGENMTIVRLLQKQWDAFNINHCISNYKAADLVCIDPEHNITKLIQVKTGYGKSPNFIVGLISDNQGHIDNLEKKIVGPWVFVQVEGYGIDLIFHFFSLSRQQVIDVIKSSNDWYTKTWDRGEKILSNNTLVGMGKLYMLSKRLNLI